MMIITLLFTYNSRITTQYLEQDMTLYEEHGATLKHNCGKRIIALSLLSFSLIFLFGPFSLFFGLFFRPESHPDLWGNHSVHHRVLTGALL